MTSDSDKAAVIQRYDVNIPPILKLDYGMVTDEDGSYVLYTDHAAALQAARDEVEREKERADLFIWEVRDTCVRAEAAERRVAELRAELQSAKWEAERNWALASGYQREMEAAEKRLVDSESAPARDSNSIQLLRQLRDSYGDDPNKFTLERNALTAAIKALAKSEVDHDAG